MDKHSQATKIYIRHFSIVHDKIRELRKSHVNEGPLLQ